MASAQAQSAATTVTDARLPRTGSRVAGSISWE